MRFDNIEYFAKTKQNRYVTEFTHTLACVVMKGLNGARAHLERVLSLHDSVLKCIKSDRKIQDMGQKMYLFTFHIVKIAQRVPFFLQNKHAYKCDIDFIQQVNKQ